MLLVRDHCKDHHKGWKLGSHNNVDIIRVQKTKPIFGCSDHPSGLVESSSDQRKK